MKPKPVIQCCECPKPAKWRVRFKDFETDGGEEIFTDYFCDECLERKPVDVEISRKVVK